MDGHIHENDLLAWILECPLQSTSISIDDGFEVFPVVGIGRRIVIVQPDVNSFVNESLLERKVFLVKWENVYLFVDCNIQICDCGSG